MILTHERLKEYVYLDLNMGKFIRIKSNSNRSKVNIKPGYIHKTLKYEIITIDNKKYYGHVLVWLYVTGKLPDKGIDHINGDKSDNRFENLRLSNQSQNSANSRTPKNNTSGFKGVCWHKKAKKWAARIKVNRQEIYLGLFKTKEEAAEAYNKAALEHFGEFARLNEI